jgi:uncharacterized protein YaiI (UPF0178 family)
VTEIFVDADACPVKAEVERVAERHGLVVHIVSNGGIRPSQHPLVKTIVVAEGADAADDWIAERITAADICITSDIPLASRCLKNGAVVLRRDLHKHLRETGQQTFNAGFTKQDRSSFLNALEIAIQQKTRIPQPPSP